MLTFYAYQSPGYNDSQEGVFKTGNEKYWKLYRDMGLNMMFLSGDNSYDGEEWETSNTKKCFDIAKKLGIKKVLLRDFRIYERILGGKDVDKAVKGLVGENYQFKTEKELDEYVKNCLKDYIYEEEFTGVSLIDEPTAFNVTAYAELYNSIKRAATELGKPDILIQTMIERLYFSHYRNAIGKIDYFGIDLYPFKYAMGGESFVFQGDYFHSLKVYADYAKKNNSEFGMVLQSFELIGDWYPNSFHRLFSANEMMLQMNAVLGFGCKSIGFYTFLNMTVGRATDPGYYADDNSSPINSQGLKTIFYYWCKNAIDYANQVEEFIEGYKYDGANLYYGKKKSDLRQFYAMGGLYASEFKEVNEVNLDDHIALMTRLVKGDKVLYMFENVFDDALSKSPYEKMKAEVIFNDVKEVEVFRNGEVERVKLKDCKYNVTLSSGEAVFLKIIK